MTHDLYASPVFASFDQSAAAFVASLRRDRRVIVVAPGCFDLLHPGHLNLLRAAGRIQNNSSVIVLLNTDASVRRLKGAARPIRPFEARAALLSHLRVVDAVIGFDEATPCQVCAKINPEWVVKGQDYLGREVPEARYAQHGLILVPLLPGYSTTSCELAVRDTQKNAHSCCQSMTDK